jgi:hypothetical protein
MLKDEYPKEKQELIKKHILKIMYKLFKKLNNTKRLVREVSI